jgi:hypothetical protein
MIFMYLLIIFSQGPRLRSLLVCMILMLFLFQYIVRSQTAGEPVVKEVDILIYCHEKTFHSTNLNVFSMT